MQTTKRDWLVPAGLIVLSLVPAAAGTARLSQLGGPATVENARFVAAPGWVAVHVVAATVFSIVGAFQFSPGLRRRNRWWHRMAGRVLLPSAFAVAVTGLWMTLNLDVPAVDRGAVFVERIVVGAAMLAALALSVEALRQWKYARHGEWMIRAYAIGLGAGTQVLTHLPWFILVDTHPGATPRAVMMGGAWAINIAVAEWIIRRPAARAVRAAPATAAA